MDLSDYVKMMYTILNSLHPSIKFTLEIEEIGSIPSLDARVCRFTSTDVVTATNKCKPTNTGFITSWNSIAVQTYFPTKDLVAQHLQSKSVYRATRSIDKKTTIAIFQKYNEKSKIITYNGHLEYAIRKQCWLLQSPTQSRSA